MKKRSLTSKENVDEAKRSKQQDNGANAPWIRRSVVGKASYGSVFIANKNAQSIYSAYPSIMAVKSAEVSVSGSIQKEKEVMDNMRGSANVIKCFGEEITLEKNQMVYNLLFEFASGGTLADVIKDSGSKGLLEVDVKRYARSILKGLSHVHKRGYVHCDLKPENVLLVANKKNKDGFIAKIGDLGLAKRVKQVKKKDPGRYWRSNPLYFSPEAVISGVQKRPADIWAFGCIVFEMLTGKQLWLAYKDLGKNEVLRRVGYENEIESVISSSSLSDEAQSFLKGCLCKKVGRRLSADMLLDHPYVKEFVDDDVNEASYGFSPWLDRAADARLNEVRIPVLKMFTMPRADQYGNAILKCE
ncbi:protein kinase superfamily protein [Artemisia annua]|uniref:Protein kinase superfamily protein n=1 Tax=Artemisia annua TaxID=35608 RepID=A0A2U1PMF5_ARTAN|nr:protein kinase superfamily protein [Artemisia annua]